MRLRHTSKASKQWSSRVKNGLAALLFLAAYTMGVAAPFMPAAQASAADTGWYTPTATHAPNNWDVSTVTNAQTSDDTYISEAGGQEQGYSFNLPAISASATINGIEVSAEAKSTDSSGCRLGVSLSWNGGTDYTTSTQYEDLTGSDASLSYGGASDIWSHTWSASQFSAANFVVKVEDKDPGGGCDNDATTSVDVLSVKVYYTVPVTPAANPTLAQACGLDIALVIDNSNSIDGSEMTSMKTALKGFTNALDGTPTQFSVTRFGTNATVVSSFTSNVATTNAAIDAVSTGGGGTNWEDGLLKAYGTFDPRTDKPNLVIFASDGNPTYHIGGGSGSSTSQADIDAAVTQANVIKNAGIRMLALGIGNDLSITNLEQISGPNVDTGDVLTSDVISSDFSTLAADLKEFATQTCGGTITTNKLIDADGNLATTGDRTAASGWTFDVNGQPSDPAATTTDTSGLTPAVDVNPGTYSVNETQQSAYKLMSASCTGATANGSQQGDAVTGLQVSANDIVSCTFINTPKRGHLTVHKVTNPANDTSTFSVTASGSGAITGDATRNITTAADVTYEVVYGTYSVAEAAATGWTQTGNTCTNVVVNDANPNPTCSITNTKLATLKIVKDAVPNDAQDFSFTTTGNGLSSFSLDDDSDATLSNNKVFSNLAPGNYTVTEQSTPGWQLTGLSCDTNNYTTNSAQLSVALTAGQTTTCTYANTKLGSFSGTKYEVNANSTIVTPAAGWVIELFNNGVSTGLIQTTGADGSYSFGNLLPGNYSVVETLKGGWTQIYSPLSPVNLTAGTAVTGQNFGNFKNGSISGYKFNDHNGNGAEDSGDEHLSGWTITLYDANKQIVAKPGLVNPVTTNAQGDYSFSNIAPGTYWVCETGQTGWVQTYPAANACAQVVIATSGQTTSGVKFGNQGQGSVTVKKNVDSNGDGVVDYSNVGNWQWDMGGSAYATGTTQSVVAGNYTLTEHQQTDYHFSAVSCTDNGQTFTVTQAPAITVPVAPGHAIVCTFTNTRDTGTLIVKKHVANDNGGTKTAGDFTVHVKQGSADIAGSPSAGSETGTSYVLQTGAYTVSEASPLPSGYTQTNIVCAGQTTGTVNVVNGQTVTCTITNADVAPQLKVVKHVVNDGTNLTKTAADFTMNVTATNPSKTSFAGSESGTLVSLDAGSYSVSENADAAYQVSYSPDCTGTAAVGDPGKTCTVTNTAILKPAIHVVKSGPATAHEGDTVAYIFTVTNPGNAPLSGLTVSDSVAGSGATLQVGDTNNNSKLDPGETWIYKLTYAIPSPQLANVDNTVKVCGKDMAQTSVCDTDNHTLDVLHPSISVKKSGPLYGYEGQIIGYTFVVTNSGDAALHNVGISDDIAIGEQCDDTSLEPGTSTTCTAHYLIPVPTISDVVNHVVASGTDSLGKTVTGTDQHTLDVIHPAINVVKTGPATAHEGDTVAYTFTVTNPGDTPLSTVTVTDDVAGNAVYVSGDTNGNNKLEPGEMWIFTKTYLVPAHQVADVVNTATACGYDPLQAAADKGKMTCDTDQHTLDVIHPLIHVSKSGPDAAYEGDDVTYSFTVTNTGDTPLSMMTVSDNIAGNAAYQSGDTNGNNQLDTTETWLYTAHYSVPAGSDSSITNTVTVCAADMLKGEACGTDQHTMHVYHPTITVTKKLYTSAADVGQFNLQIDGHTYVTGGDGATTGVILVKPGDHTVAETAAEGTDLNHYDSEINCQIGDASVHGYGTSLTGVAVTGDEHADCTIYNTRKAHLIVNKNAVPNDAQDFDFTVAPVNVNEEGNAIERPAIALDELSQVNQFPLDDDSDQTLSNSKTLELSSGWYSVDEAPVSGWDITGVDCGDNNWYVDKETGVLYVKLGVGAEVSCTFTNTKRAVVAIVEDAQPDSGQPFSFVTNLAGDGTTFSLTDDAVNPSLVSQTFGGIVAGTYTVTQDAVSGWSLHDISCTGAEVTRLGSIITITVLPGANVRCTFVNQKNVAPQVLGASTLEDTGNPFGLPLMLSSGLLGLSLLTILQQDSRRGRGLLDRFVRALRQPFTLPTA